jgi:hypothetical protein
MFDQFSRLNTRSRSSSSLVDTNGDGRALAGEVAVLADARAWQQLEHDDDSSDVGRWWNS